MDWHMVNTKCVVVLVTIIIFFNLNFMEYHSCLIELKGRNSTF